MGLKFHKKCKSFKNFVKLCQNHKKVPFFLFHIQKYKLCADSQKKLRRCASSHPQLLEAPGSSSYRSRSYPEKNAPKLNFQDKTHSGFFVKNGNIKKKKKVVCQALKVTMNTLNYKIYIFFVLCLQHLFVLLTNSLAKWP